jgi:undecaprenyl-diphosphatase
VRRTGRPHPALRLGVGVAAIAASLAPLRRDTVGPHEQRVFRAVNDLPDALHAPAWAVMQLGTVGAAPVAAAIAYIAGERRLAPRLLVGGVGTWAASKVVKRMAGRPRPFTLLPETKVRGREATGLGYPSGHAGVALALGIAAFPRLGRRGRSAVTVIVPTVGLTRMYVGAHLPLDVVSGAALGLALDAIVELASQRR